MKCGQTGRWVLMGGLAAAIAVTAQAHGVGAADRASLLSNWSWEPGIVVSLFVSAALYGSGLYGLRTSTKAPRRFRREAACFWTGWSVLVVALDSPLHPLGQQLFSAHMIQHELLMIIAAPLLVLGRPGFVWLCAFPRSAARRMVINVRSVGGERVWLALSNPFVASLVHALALWIWHVPILFAATTDHEWVHALQHATFLGSALLFWHAVLLGRRRAGYGLAVLYLFFTAMQSGALGALITFASALWYPVSAPAAAAWGVTPLQDQQIGGLIMWIPGGLVYIVAALALFARWLRESERRHEPDRAGSPLITKAKCAPTL